eukprot:SAG31_NODE_15472_length_753_cov_1.151376_1_plen_73_part_10
MGRHSFVCIVYIFCLVHVRLSSHTVPVIWYHHKHRTENVFLALALIYKPSWIHIHLNLKLAQRRRTAVTLMLV